MGIKGRMKTNSVTFTVCVAVNLSIALWAAIAVLSVNDVYAAPIDAFLKLPGIELGSEKANDIAGETATRNEHTEFARERISEIADRLSDDVD